MRDADDEEVGDGDTNDDHRDCDRRSRPSIADIAEKASRVVREEGTEKTITVAPTATGTTRAPRTRLPGDRHQKEPTTRAAATA